MNADLVFATAFVQENARGVANLPVDEIVHGAEAIDSARRRGSRVFIVGNGGSAATASHMACDLDEGGVTLGPTARACAMSLGSHTRRHCLGQ